ncbi:GntR family transcriptional regulator [Paraburkholderia sp. FT54]|uniref:GntR family transcriptional regulator n=1 Tax=Paraburkholderia sp. FT54 TaxID=3074437 RepID=UPI002877B957|nr:GntR family transcriptional regulator [Paraburkholderia sp. FT54]WNC94986.1 GntR family transcriptional regulator [Paraburkholderia sp. FT54]
MALTPKTNASTTQAAGTEGWKPVRARTLVDEAVDAIIAAAARGLVLPGDRIVETEIAQKLNISRVPVREALRLLESQGIVISEPYKGIRLAPVTRDRLEQVLEVRVALELIAVRRTVALGRHKDSATVRRLERCIDELELMAARKDPYGLAQADVAFHRELCDISGNDFLRTIWEGVARQLTIVVGLSTLDKSMRDIVKEHRTLLEAVTTGDIKKIEKALGEHIRDQNARVDLEKIIEDRRRACPPG